MQKQTKIILALIGLVVLLLCLCVSGFSFFVFKAAQKAERKNDREFLPIPTDVMPSITPEAPTVTLTPTKSPTPTSEPITPTIVVSNTGTVEGGLSYPSEYLPPTIIICAETTSRVKVKCTSEHIVDSRFKYGKGYSLDLEPGEYYIFAKSSENEDYKSYYNEFVTCGIEASCKSHKEIMVKVESGKIISDINPWDWYNY